jgi:predicted RNase H-like nuclease (RuvC/YqgF family)
MKTVIDTHHHSSFIDLSDIGDMVKKFCNEVERLEERIEELGRENSELKGKIEEFERGKVE